MIYVRCEGKQNGSRCVVLTVYNKQPRHTREARNDPKSHTKALVVLRFCCVTQITQLCRILCVLRLLYAPSGKNLLTESNCILHVTRFRAEARTITNISLSTYQSMQLNYILINNINNLSWKNLSNNWSTTTLQIQS